jgi:dTDP-4-dehydrorhamnose 3,5-epimerase
MKFTKLEIPDLILIEPLVYNDDRGYFTETYKQNKLEKFMGRSLNFCQENETKSSYGVLRGLHYQLNPHAQTKLVRVTQGAVLDVVVDLRKDSPNFGKHISVELSEDNKRQLLIPAGFAHGFVVLKDNTKFLYRVDNYYNPESERGIAFNDPELRIDWKLNQNDLKLSIKDSNLPLYSKAEYF